MGNKAITVPPQWELWQMKILHAQFGKMDVFDLSKKIGKSPVSIIRIGKKYVKDKWDSGEASTGPVSRPPAIYNAGGVYDALMNKYVPIQ
ncbi:MAG: hypothetical protein EOP56_09270 [Sphingobacteriales bacterium]|nr:MAG: hypothetical protein EOP56_09270 [Sphingobacteriales bacterium]